MRRFVLFTLVALVVSSVAWAAEVPVAVSPGHASTVALIEDRCPTFSWGAGSGARGYELVVYQLDEEDEKALPVLQQSFNGSVSGWTPSLDVCLARGRKYAWSVRAVGEKTASEWSAPSLFQVAGGPSEAEFEEAVEVVRQYLEQEHTGSTNMSRQTAQPSSGRGSGTVLNQSAGIVAPSPLAALGGDSALQVNGSSVVTVATLGNGIGAAMCLALDVYRWIDQGDGTVLDCNTGKTWLKDASCLGTWPYAAGANPNIFDKVAELNSGVEFNCDGYTKGTHTDWQVPGIGDFCSRDVFPTGGVCPTEDAPDSLIDSSVGPPAVANAKGDAVWMDGDAFIDVVPPSTPTYWSSTFDLGLYWVVNINTGDVIQSGVLPSDSRYVWPVRGGQ